MKVAFWGTERESGTTSNLMALASYIACHSKRQVAMLQLEKENRGLADYYSTRESTLVKEKNDYFVLEGLDYLLSVGKKRELTSKLVAENMESLIEEHLYCLTAGNRKLNDYYPEETNRVMQQIITLLDKEVDFTFIDCGNRMDDWTMQMMREADLVVVNLKQTAEAFDKFFLQHRNLAPKVIYLVGNYRKESVYNKRNLQRIYRIPKEKLAVMPVNQEFWQACEKGRLDKYMKGKRNPYATEVRRYFMRELGATMRILLEQINGSEE